MNTDHKICYVLIHGAWHQPSCWDRFIPYLDRADTLVKTPHLPGHHVGADNLNAITLESYCQHIETELASIPDDYRIVIVAHSMAGMIVMNMLDRLRYDKLVMLAAFVPKDNESLFALVDLLPVAGELSPYLRIDDDNGCIHINKNGIEKVLYNTSRDKEIQPALDSLCPQPIKPFCEPAKVHEEKLKTGSLYYIACREDKAISLASQEFMAKRYPCHFQVLDCDHSPMLSVPSQLARALMSYE